MTAGDVVGLTVAVRQRRADWCICGGWGVDALLGRQTRPHEDLDVLVEREDLPSILLLLGEAGYGDAQPWEESLPLAARGACAGAASAFVVAAGDRIVDVHVYEIDGGDVVPLWAVDRRWAQLDAMTSGTIAGTPVTCLSPALQLELHRGYDLPLTHQDDVAALQRLLRRAGR